MANKKNRKEQYTEANFQETMAELMAEIKLVKGGDSQRPRFKGFKVVESIVGTLKDGIVSYERGQIQEATKTLLRALSSLQWREREYFRRSIEKYFSLEKEALVIEEVDQDLIDRLDKPFEAINRLIRSAEYFDLALASKLYWETEDKIVLIRQEHQGHLNKMAKKAREEQLQREEEQKKKVLEAQARFDESDAWRRREKAEALRGQLAQMLA